jgi:hypothetical protein
MLSESFITAAELVAFVNTNGITAAKIAEIEFANGRFFLFYFT